MKEKILYQKKCFVCAGLSTFVLRDVNVNPVSDENAELAIENVKGKKPGFLWCETCKLITKQEVVSFDY